MAFKKLRIISIIFMLISIIFTGNSIGESKPSSDNITRTTPVTLYVGSNATYHNIQDAIDASSPGDSVFVQNGTYYESLNISKPITLIGESWEETKIYNSISMANGININASNVTISNFTISYDNLYPETAAIYLSGVQDCNISNNNISTAFYAIYIDGSYNNTFMKNSFKNNLIGFWIIDSDRNTFIDNYLSINNYGFGLERSCNNSFINNKITNCEIGFYTSTSNNNSFLENNISLNNMGFMFWGSNGNSLKNNMIQTFGYIEGYWVFEGILFYYSSYNTMINNSLEKSTFSIYGKSLEHWTTHNIDTSNTVNNKPIYYWKNKREGSISQDVNTIILANCSNIKIENLNFTEHGTRIHLVFSSKIEIINNSFRELLIQIENSDNNSIINCTTTGRSIISLGSSDNNLFKNINEIDKSSEISLYESNYNEFINNIMIKSISIRDSFHNIINNNTVWRINFERSHKNIIIGNSFEYNGKGIKLKNCSENIIELNLITNQSSRGIHLGGSSNNTIIKNTFAFNKGMGIYIHSKDVRLSNDNYITYPSENNLIYHNNFIFNKPTNYQSEDRVTNNWENGYPSGGNFWSDYEGEDEFSGPNQDQIGSDGIGDSPYIINSYMNDGDNYPLMEIYYHGFDLPKSHPSTPINIERESGDGYVKLTWSEPFYNGGSPIIQYVIYRYSSVNINGTSYGRWDEFSVPGYVHEFKDTNVENNQRYIYMICAENEMGKSPNSSEEGAHPQGGSKPVDNDPFAFIPYSRGQCLLYIIFIFIIIIISFLLTIVRKKISPKSSLEENEQMKKKKKNKNKQNKNVKRQKK